MRVTSHATEQYRKTSALAESKRETRRTEAQASVKTTTFGFRLGQFGLDYSSSKTVLDPSLSRDVREKREKAQSFRAEAEVEALRAKVGREGAAYRQQDVTPDQDSSPPLHRVRSAMAAYADSAKEILPPPGNMLAAVV